VSHRTQALRLAAVSLPTPAFPPPHSDPYRQTFIEGTKRWGRRTGALDPMLGSVGPEQCCSPGCPITPKQRCCLCREPRACVPISRGRTRSSPRPWESHVGFAAPHPAWSYGRRHRLLHARMNRRGFEIDILFSFPYL